MRVVVVGATGNVGTSVLDALARDPRVEFVLGVARRLPQLVLPKVEWARADVTRDELVPHFRASNGQAEPVLDPQKLGRLLHARLVLELLAGMRDAAGVGTPPLDPAGGRLHELAGGVGQRQG